jgi:nucleoporin NUP159
VRFNKAKTDTDFARMLKARTLGPEHLETQTQLRRNIRVCVAAVR